MRSSLHHHEGLDALPEVLIGHTNHRDLKDPFALQHRLLDLRRTQPKTSTLD